MGVRTNIVAYYSDSTNTFRPSFENLGIDLDWKSWESEIEITEDWVLLFENNRWQLAFSTKLGLKPFFIDFENHVLQWRMDRGGKDLLYKAIPERENRILDATAGMGNDTLLLANRGNHVCAVEKNVILFILLQDALRRAREGNLAKVVEKIELRWGNASEYFAENFDTIYLDPLFDPSKKRGASKKSMAVTHMLVEFDPVGDKELVESAIRTHTKVVVKRHVKAPMLFEPVTYQIKGDTVRYDIYRPHDKGANR